MTVPTPVTKLKKPDLSPLLKATRMIGKMINQNDIIVYESTVYPGCIEEKCVPILEKNILGLNTTKIFLWIQSRENKSW